MAHADGGGEKAQFWRRGGVDLLHARYIDYAFGKHVHDTYAIGVIEAGVEEFWYRGAMHRAGAGRVVLVNPEHVHTGHAGVPSGWRYRMIYPSIEVVSEIADEIGMARGTPYFPEAVVDAPATDPVPGRALRAAHVATERGDELAASTLLRTGLAALLRRYASAGRSGQRPGPPDAPAVRRAREILHESLLQPPSLEQLAESVGSRPFTLIRSFKDATGLPPHAYLNQVRVRRARDLLRAGDSPAEAAASAGFADQAHLTRHFKRTYGVPPGSYRSGIKAA